MTKPIKPSEIRERKKANIPPEVIEIFNDFIVKDFNGSYAIVNQNTAVEAIVKKMGITRGEVFNNHYLDVEPYFEDAGWNVEYDKPAYNETYEATFKFTKKRGKK